MNGRAKFQDLTIFFKIFEVEWRGGIFGGRRAYFYISPPGVKSSLHSAFCLVLTLPGTDLKPEQECPEVIHNRVKHLRWSFVRK